MDVAEGVRVRRRAITRSAEAERPAFCEWVRPHWAMMHALAVQRSPRGEGDDVLQEALASAWRKRAQFDPRRGTARGWLLAIVADQARKSHRRSRATPTVLADAAGDDQLPDLDLRRAVAALPGRQRIAVELHYFLELPVAEVAEVMSCAEGTVKASLSAARKNLRASLGEDFR